MFSDMIKQLRKNKLLPAMAAPVTLIVFMQSIITAHEVKSYVKSEQLADLLLSCQATGRLWEAHSHGRHSTSQPATYTKSPQITSQSGLWPAVSAWAAPVAVAMTRFVILSLYLHSITPASRHIRVVWSRGCGWPQGKGCLRWSKLTLLGDTALVM